MATQTVEFRSPPSQTVTAKLFAIGSDTQVASVSSTEATNRKGTYAAAYTDVAAGEYELIAFVGAVPVARWFVTLTLTTATFQARDKVNAELDSASRLAIWNTLTTETFTADSFGELLIISDGTNGREVKVTGAGHIAADIHDVQPDGLSGSTEIANIENASGYLLAVLAGACADPQTASETYAITVFGSTFTVDMAGQTSTGTRTAPTLTKT
jgi:hypothetical protein